MKLLIISDAWHPQVNGVVRTYENFCTELSKMGHDVQVIGPSDFAWRMPLPGYQEIELVLFPYRSLCKMIDACNPDAIHIATEGPLGCAARRYCIRRNKGFTSSYHTQFPDYIAKRLAKPFCHFYNFVYQSIYKAAKSFIKKFHDKADSMMIATQSLEDELKSWGIQTPMHRVTRGVHMDIFSPLSDPKENIFHDLDGPVALYVGRVAIEKNIEAFLNMEWNGSKVVVGSGPALDELQEKYPDTVFAGKKTGKALALHYASADLFVFPSKTDTFGIVLIEALACGLPVAAYPVMGPIDIITDDRLGALHNDLSLAAKEAMQSSYSREERAQHVKKNYSWTEATKQFLHAIES